MPKIKVENTEITITSFKEQDYICITDMANAKRNEIRASDIIKNWLRNRYTIEFLGTWEMIHNPNVLSCSDWIERTNAIGIFVQKGR